MEPADRAADGGLGRLTVPIAYRERPPHAALQPHLTCAWTARARAGQRILPDGCIDIVWIGEETLSVAGPDTSANVAGLAEGSPVAGVRFRPGRAPAFLGASAASFRDASFALEDLWGVEARRLAERLAGAPDLSRKTALLEAALLLRLDAAGDVDPSVGAAVDAIETAPATVRVGRLSREIGVSERHLRRRFEGAVGYGPKTLGRVLRFRRFLDLVEGERLPLSRAAAEAGYADQPHLTRECNDLAGLPPAELLAVRNVQDDVRTVDP